MTRCPACSSEIESESRFCPECGQALESATSLPTQAGGQGSTGAAPGSAPPLSTDPGLTGRFAPGTMLNERYRVVALLGRGGMGEVYRAEDLKLGQTVALKFLPRAVEKDPERLARLLGEVRTALQVTHPNVCRVYDIAEVDGRNFLSMEYVDGEDLASLLRRIGRLPQDKANDIARQLCAGLAAAHELGILHRDLKPANIMLDGRGQVRITDFGLAGAVEEIGAADVTAGTPGYMSPEQLSGTTVTVRSDLYALGLVLYEIYTGTQAFEATTLDELRRLREESTPASPGSIVEGLDPAVEEMVLRCLEREPSRRPASARAVAGALPGGDPLAAALAAGETPSPELVAAAGHAEALHPGIAVGTAVLAVALLALGAWTNGRNLITAYLPLDKPPAVVEDRAREIIRELGYTDPVDADPVDTAVSYGFSSRIADIDIEDRTADRWEQIRDRADMVLMFYRQRPAVMIPEPREWGTFIGALVTPSNPEFDVPGDAEVVMAGDGLLRGFNYLMPAYSQQPAPAEEPDWSRAFELAGLDMAAFQRVAPQYHQRVGPEQQAAWIGSLPLDPPVPVRIEAGAVGTRIVTFRVLNPIALERNVGPPQRDPGPPWVFPLRDLVVLAITAVAMLLARRNIRRGRADRRAARVLAATTLLLTILWDASRAHGLFTSAGLGRLFPILGLGVFYGVIVWSVYVAFEPYCRRIWPTIFISWNRLLDSSRRRFADPLVGRAILLGLAVGCALTFLPALAYALETWIEGVPPRPAGLANQMLSGAPAISSLFLATVLAIIDSLFLVLVLVAGRSVFRKRWLAVGFVIVVFVAVNPTRSLFVVGALTVLAAVMTALLLRGGLIAAIAGRLAWLYGVIAAASDWSAWHARTTPLALALISALAAYAAWAAMSGWDGQARAA